MKTSFILITTLIGFVLTTGPKLARAQQEGVPISDSRLPVEEMLPEQTALAQIFTPVQLDSAIEANMAEYHIPGLAALIFHEDQVVWSGMYGWADIDSSIPVSDTVLFLVASISKTFVANAAMQLWENGLLDLDADVNDYVPFSVVNPYYPSDSITMRMILTHTSSIARNDALWQYDRQPGADYPVPLADYLEDFFAPGGAMYADTNYKPYQPGTDYQYSNFGFALAGLVVQEVAGISLEEYCQDSLFQPLGMDETSWFVANVDTANVATPYTWNGSSYTAYSHDGVGPYPCVQLRTSLDQLFRHIQAFMNYGELEGQRILDSATVALMMTDQFPDVNLGYGVAQGIGWANYFGGDFNTWGHGGTFYGSGTYMSFDPDQRTGFIFLSNRWTNDGHGRIGAYLRYFSQDSDGDGIVAGLDNCPFIYNPGQADADGDDIGDPCDCLEEIVLHTGAGVPDQFGWQVSGVGDVDGDGYDDLAIGAPLADPGGSVNAGCVYVFSGKTNDTLFVIPGEVANDRMGRGVSELGDVNGDDHDDFIVSAHRNDDGNTNAGKVYVISGLDGSVLRSVTGGNDGDNLGTAIAGIGDINSDNIPDFIAGASQMDDPSVGPGFAVVYSGADVSVLHDYTGESSYDLFGYAVGSAGDVNNDNLPDFIVGAYANDAAGTNAGRAYLYSGDGSLLHTFDGENEGDWLGSDVVGAGDVNNDGFDDILIGSPYFSGEQMGSGKTYVYSGADYSLIREHDGHWSGRFGYSVTGMGDLNGDGHDDYAVGEAQAYRSYVYSGVDGSELYMVAGDNRNDWFGRDICGTADLNGDGILDLIVGAYNADDGAGRAYAFSFGDADGDGVLAGCDNCPATANYDQEDLNDNGIGDVCEGCCGFFTDPPGLTGNANCSEDGKLTLSDISRMIDFLYISKAALCCYAAGNTNGSWDDGDCKITLSDISRLIDALYISKQPPADCMPDCER